MQKAKIWINTHKEPGELELPKSLRTLIESGKWSEEEFVDSNLVILGDKAAQKLNREENEIWLLPPPFQKISTLVKKGEKFWTEVLTNYGEIDYDRSLVIADFGPGSDSPIILYYETSGIPSVHYLHWESSETTCTHKWIKTHGTFDKFATDLGLIK